MRDSSEGLHEGPALGRGGRGKGATPQPMAGPRGRDRHAAHLPAVRRRRQGTRGPLPLPPPPPIQVHEQTEADRRNGGPAPPPKRPLHPGCGGTTAEAGARTPRPLPADGGPAAPRMAQTEPPPPPHPAALARRRPTGPRPTPASARQPRRHEYTPGGHVRDNGWQADPRRGGGRGGGNPKPPPAPPPRVGSHRSGSPPPRSRGDPAPPGRDRDAGGGGAVGPAHRVPQRPQPPAPAGVAAAGQAHTSVPEQRAHQACGRRTAAHQNSMEAAPYMTLP